jgi:hypothetical protein
MAKSKKVTPDVEDDMLGMLEASVEEKPVTKGEKDRPVVSAPAIMTEFAAVKTAFDVLEERKDILGGELKSTIWEEFTNLWFASKARPSNPKVETKKGRNPDCQAIYQCRTNFKVQYREGVSGRAGVIDPLKEIGFSDEMANKIFDENLEIVVETALRPFNELRNGSWSSGEGGKEFKPATDVQKSAANKLLNFVVGKDAEPLTAAERAECIVKDTNYIVKAGFLDRAVHYCNSADQLRALLTVVKPGEAVSYVKFAQSDTEDEKNTRLREVFSELFPVKEKVA